MLQRQVQPGGTEVIHYVAIDTDHSPSPTHTVHSSTSDDIPKRNDIETLHHTIMHGLPPELKAKIEANMPTGMKRQALEFLQPMQRWLAEGHRDSIIESLYNKAQALNHPIDTDTTVSHDSNEAIGCRFMGCSAPNTDLESQLRLEQDDKRKKGGENCEELENESSFEIVNDADVFHDLSK